MFSDTDIGEDYLFQDRRVSVTGIQKYDGFRQDEKGLGSARMNIEDIFGNKI